MRREAEEVVHAVCRIYIVPTIVLISYRVEYAQGTVPAAWNRATAERRDGRNFQATGHARYKPLATDDGGHHRGSLHRWGGAGAWPLAAGGGEAGWWSTGLTPATTLTTS